MTGLHHAAPGGHLQGIWVTGALVRDAVFHLSTGQPPHAFIDVVLQPPSGLPLHARVDLGTDPTDHMGAQAMVPALRQAALVAVGATGLAMPRTDHHTARHELVGATALIHLAPQPVRRPSTAAKEATDVR